MLRLLFTLAAWGIAGLFLIGPVVAVLAITLSLVLTILAILAPFVLLGLLFWLPYRLFFARDLRWQQVRQAGTTAWQSGVVPPARWCAGKVRGAAGWPGAVCSWFAAVGRIALETICGALIGTGMGWLLASSLSRSERASYAMVGCLAGALLGLLVGLANHLAALRGRTSSS
jgi:hypothetical protein